MLIRCKNCGHVEEVNKDLIIKVIGGALPIGGFGAWVAYILAGTGLALPIVVAMILGGTGMLIFKDQIVKFLCNKKYKCKKCPSYNWE